MKKILPGILILFSISSHAVDKFEPIDSGFSKETIQFLANINDSMVITSIEESQNPAFSMLIAKIVDRLLSSSNLSYTQGDLPRLRINYSNDIRVLPPEMKAGILTVYAAIFMSFDTEDQVAAVIANSLVHHFRAHDQKLLEIEFDFWPLKKIRQGHNREEQKVEADLLSLSLLKSAGYETGASIEALLKLNSMFRQLPPAVTPYGIFSEINQRITRLEEVLGSTSEVRDSKFLDASVSRELISCRNIYF